MFTFVEGKLIQKQTKIDPKDKDSYFERYVEPDGKTLVIVSLFFVSLSPAFKISIAFYRCVNLAKLLLYVNTRSNRHVEVIYNK